MDALRTALNSHHRRFQLVRHILEKPFLRFVCLFHIAAKLPSEEADQHTEYRQHRKKDGIQICRILHNRSDIHVKDVRICVLIFIGFDTCQSENKAASAGFQGMKFIGSRVFLFAVFPQLIFGF